MTKFLLIRHAATEWVGHGLAGRLPGIGLSESGRTELSSLVTRVEAHGPVDAVYSSPLERTRETAAALGQAVHIHDAFLEIDYGHWTGRMIADLEPDEEWRQYNHFRSTRRIPGGESMLEVQTRVVSAMEHLRALHPEQTVAIVTHADVIRIAIAHFLGMPLDHLLRLEIGTASVSIVAVSDWDPRLILLNER